MASSRPLRRAPAALAAALLTALLTGCAAMAFRDVERSEAPDAVRWLEARGTVTGFPDDTFRPAAPVTRAELVAILAREAGAPAAAPDCFADVASDAWYAAPLCGARAAGWFTGDADGRARPDEPATLAELAVLAQRAHGTVLEPAPGRPWYAPYLRRAAERGWLPPHATRPRKIATRDDVARVLYGLLADAAPRAAWRSEGCGRPAPAAPPTTATVAGAARSWLARVPAGYDPDVPAPLLIAFHGRTNGNAQVRRYMRLDAALPEAIALYPAALPAAGGGYAWAAPGDPPGALRDYALFDAMLETTAAAYCVDLSRVWVTGHSLGASFAQALGCARGDRIRAVAVVAGGVQDRACTGPSAALVAHHPQDRLVPLAAGAEARDVLALNAGASGPPAPATDPALAALRCERLDSPAGLQPVLWCPHDDAEGPGGRFYPHTWPDAAPAAIAAFLRGLP